MMKIPPPIPARKPAALRFAAAARYCLLALLFSLPFSTSASNILALLLLLLWLGGGRWREKAAEIRGNEVALAVLAYLGLHLLGLLWSENLGEGVALLQSQWKLLLLPATLNLVAKEDRQDYLHAFVAAMALAMTVSYLIWGGVLVNRHATLSDPTPFMSHIVYNPFLAWAIYLTLQQALSRNLAPARKYALLALALLLTGNLFLTQGQSGQIAFLALLLLFLGQRWRGRLLPAAVASLLLLALLLGGAYAASPNFRQRLALTGREAATFRAGQDGSNTSLGQRLTFARNTLRLIQAHPLLGVGTGDFAAEYAKINRRHSPNYPPTDNPHNQYLKAAGQFGPSGVALLLLIFFRQWQAARRPADEFADLRQALPLFFFVLCLGESYLQIHPTTLLFALFAGILFKQGGDSA